MAGDKYFSAFYSLIIFSFGRRITPRNIINNELLYLYSAAAPGELNTGYSQIANASTLAVILLETS